MLGLAKRVGARLDGLTAVVFNFFFVILNHQISWVKLFLILQQDIADINF